MPEEALAPIQLFYLCRGQSRPADNVASVDAKVIDIFLLDFGVIKVVCMKSLGGERRVVKSPVKSHTTEFSAYLTG